MTVRLLAGLWFGSRDQRLGTAARGRSAGLRLRSGSDLAAATVSARAFCLRAAATTYATAVTCFNSPSSFSGYLVCAYCVISVLGVRKVPANSVRLLIFSQPKRVPESSEFPFLLRLGHRFFLCDWLEFLGLLHSCEVHREAALKQSAFLEFLEETRYRELNVKS